MTDKPKKHRLDLNGPHGTPTFLLGYADGLCARLGKDFKPIEDEMKSGSYEHLLEVFEREFGDYVELLK